MRPLRVLTALSLAACLAPTARAQYTPGSRPPQFGGIGNPGLNRPVYSPYLNLLRNTNSNLLNPTLQNYYGLVRPEIQLRNAATTLQQELITTQQNIGYLEQQAASANSLPVTGHGAYFLNTRGYFLSGTAGGGGARAGGAQLGGRTGGFGGATFGGGPRPGAGFGPTGASGAAPTPAAPRR